MQATSASKLSDFEVLGRLGSGSFGTVYKVRRKVDGETYVLKAVIIEGMSTKEQLEAINEVRIMASLDHPSCVRYYDSFLDGGRLNIIMEYCNGGDLQLFLKRHAKEGLRVSEERIWRVFLQIAVGLHYVHQQRILHRDMKSANVFLCKDASVKIGDLGVARVLGTNTNFVKTCVGTPYYLSPELCEDKPYNEKSDVWALGCILYECLTLKHPFDAKNQGALILKIIQGHYPPVNGSYSPEIRQLVNRLLSRDSRRRPYVRELLALPMCMAKAEALGIDMPPEVTAMATERAKSRPGALRKKTLRLNTSAAPSDAPRKPPSGRASARNRGASRGNRVRRDLPRSAVPDHKPRTRELSVEARAAAIGSRKDSAKYVVATSGSDRDRDDTDPKPVSASGGRQRPASRSGSSKPPALRFSPSGRLLSPSEAADAEAVAALPKVSAAPAKATSPAGGRGGGQLNRTRPSASQLASLTSTLRTSTGAAGAGGGAAPEEDDPTPGIDDSDDFDAIMQRQFEEDMLAAQSKAREESKTATEDDPRPPSSSVGGHAPSAFASATPDPTRGAGGASRASGAGGAGGKKRVVHVKRVPAGAPQDFWDPVDPTKLPNLPHEVPAGFWDPHQPPAAASPGTGAGAGAGAGPPRRQGESADVDVSISLTEVMTPAADGGVSDDHVGASDREFGSAHAVFVGVVEDDVGDVSDDSDGAGYDDDFDAADGGGDGGAGGGGGRTADDPSPAPSVEEALEDVDAEIDEELDAAVPLSLDELAVEDERIREQINKQQEECEKILPPDVFDKLAELLTSHKDFDINELEADTTAHAEKVASKLQGLDVHEYIAVYKLALYASKLRENAREIAKRRAEG